LSRAFPTQMNDTTAPIKVQPFTVTLSLEGLELSLTLPDSLELHLNAQGEYTCTHSCFDVLQPPVLHQLQNFAIVLESLLNWREWTLRPEDHWPTFYPSALFGLADEVVSQE